jgi:hypothetical protein
MDPVLISIIVNAVTKDGLSKTFYDTVFVVWHLFNNKARDAAQSRQIDHDQELPFQP